MRRLPLLSSALLVTAGCSEVAQDADTATADLIAPVWTTDQAETTLSFQIHGSGDVPAGSECVGGDALVAVGDDPMELTVDECVGQPLRKTIAPGTAMPAPRRIWDASSNAVILEIGGEGFTPPGSFCAAGSSDWTFSTYDGVPSLGGLRCVRGANGRYFQQLDAIELDEAQAARLRTVLARTSTAAVARCTPNARYLSAVVMGTNGPGQPTSASFTGADNACVLGIDRGFVDLQPLRAIIEELTEGR